MTIFNRYFGEESGPVEDYSLPSQQTAPEFGKVYLRRVGDEIHVQVTILMEPHGKDAEGWQTGVALDASASMRGWFGRELLGSLPPEVARQYAARGWLTRRVQDGCRVSLFKPEAIADACRLGHLRTSENIVEPLAREFIAYLAGGLDADGGTTVLYWAGGDGHALEVVGDFTEDECRTLTLGGPKSMSFGQQTHLLPAVQYFVDRFAEAPRGIYLFVTDGVLDDLPAVQRYTRTLARDIAAGRRPPVKCVLIGVGTRIDKAQLLALDNLDTGTEVDIWDHKIAAEMRALVEIFAEVVQEHSFVAPAGVVYDAAGQVVWKSNDGLPARLTFTLPAGSPYFILEVRDRRIHQSIDFPAAD